MTCSSVFPCRPENSAILAPSVKHNRTLFPLTNALSEHYHIPVAVPCSDETQLDSDVVNGKLTVSTWHMFKGMERDLVFVYGADSSYLDFMARNLPDDRCPNETYVALTRARKQVCYSLPGCPRLSAEASFSWWFYRFARRYLTFVTSHLLAGRR
jgi:superfamily I DNA/RNA helicase